MPELVRVRDTPTEFVIAVRIDIMIYLQHGSLFIASKMTQTRDMSLTEASVTRGCTLPRQGTATVVQKTIPQQHHGFLALPHFS
jgi:hypothetical protein